jgi:hypothetical protein
MRFPGRVAHSIDTIDKQGVPTLKKIDREEPASSSANARRQFGILANLFRRRSTRRL